jgi:hypothetical protein
MKQNWEKAKLSAEKSQLMSTYFLKKYKILRTLLHPVRKIFPFPKEMVVFSPCPFTLKLSGFACSTNELQSNPLF